MGKVWRQRSILGLGGLEYLFYTISEGKILIDAVPAFGEKMQRLWRIIQGRINDFV